MSSVCPREADSFLKRILLFSFFLPILSIKEKGGDVVRAEGQSPVLPELLLRRQLNALQECSPTLLLLDSLQLALTQAHP